MKTLPNRANAAGLIGGLSVLLLCAAGVAQGQQPVHSGSSLRQIAHLTPAQEAAEQERAQLFREAKVALKAGQYALAEDSARQSVAAGEDSGLTQEYLASALNAQGKTQEALKAYKEIADRGFPSSYDSVPYSLLLLKTGHWAQAVAVYNQALPNIPDRSLLPPAGLFSADVPQPKELEVALHVAQGLIGSVWGSPAPCYDSMTQFGEALRLAPDSPVTNYYYGYGWQTRVPMRSKAKALYAARAGAAFQKAALLGGDAVRRSAEAELSRIKTDEASQTK